MTPTSRPPPATDAAIQKRGRKTDDNGNAMLQNILSKLFKKENSGKYSRSAAVGKMGKGRFCYTICSRGCTRLHLDIDVENCQHVDQKQLTRRLALDLDMESTHYHNPRHVEHGQ